MQNATTTQYRYQYQLPTGGIEKFQESPKYRELSSFPAEDDTKVFEDGKLALELSFKAFYYLFPQYRVHDHGWLLLIQGQEPFTLSDFLRDLQTSADWVSQSYDEAEAETPTDTPLIALHGNCWHMGILQNDDYLDYASSLMDYFIDLLSAYTKVKLNIKLADLQE